MRHGKSHKRLGKPSDHRRAMLRNLATSFMEHGRLTTTLARAKELRPIVEKLITKGKRSTLHSQRLVSSYLFTEKASRIVTSEHAIRFKDRNGGYTRIVRLGERFGDGAKQAIIELVDFSLQDAQEK